MEVIDWLVLGGFFAYTLWDGLRGKSGKQTLDGLLLAGRNMRGWAVGLSIMATQASAITFIGTTGQAYMYDMKFIQIYLGLPVAMVILSVTLLPLYNKLKVYTAYEALEQRFGLRVRLLTGSIFLLSRGISLGISIAAPAYVLALILNLPLRIPILIIGIGATVYTMFGGIHGVIRTDIKQMALMLVGLFFCFAWIILHLPEDISTVDALHLAGAAGKLESISFEFDISEKYNIWSGLIAGMFLMLSYFGADQSQVQRYLSARSLNDARSSLMISATVKIPMQFLILLLGVFLYVFYMFHERPLLFVPDQTGYATEWQKSSGDERGAYEAAFQQLHIERQQAARSYLSELDSPKSKEDFVQLDLRAQQLRKAEIKYRKSSGEEAPNDTNYVFPFFILHELPAGWVGLIVAAILAAALSSIDSMLNSLAAVSVVDIYRRMSSRDRSDTHYLHAARLSTALWGLIATGAALLFGETESIIELINQIGSYVYGPILGVFLLLAIPRTTGNGAFWGMVVGLLMVLLTASIHTTCCDNSLQLLFPMGDIPDGIYPWVEYLWLNPIGAFCVLLVGLSTRKRKFS